MSIGRILSVTILTLLFSVSCKDVVNPTPDAYVFDGKSRGCGDFTVYKATVDGTKAVHVSVDKKAWQLSDVPQTFDVGHTAGLEIFLDNFGDHSYWNRRGYCFPDIEDLRPDPKRLKAVAGQAIISTSKFDANGYLATVILENVSFQGAPDSITITIPRIEIRNVQVGWYIL